MVTYIGTGTEVWADLGAATVTSGGTDAPSAGTSESWTVDTTVAFPACDESGTPATFFYIRFADGSTEIALVTDAPGGTGSSQSWTVTRGACATTPVTHTTGFAIVQVSTAQSLVGLQALAGVAPSGDATGATDTSRINALLAAGVSVQMGAGTIITNAMLAIPSGVSGVTLAGAGMGQTTVQPVSGATFNAVGTEAAPSGTVSGYTYEHCVWRDFTINMTNAAGTTDGEGNGFYGFGLIECQVVRVSVTASPNWGFVFDSTSDNDCYWSTIRDCYCNSCAAGILVAYNTAMTVMNNVTSANSASCAASQPLYTAQPGNDDVWAIYSASENTRMIGNVINSGADSGEAEAVHCYNRQAIITGNYFNTTVNTALNSGEYDKITGNDFQDCCKSHASPIVKLNEYGTFVGNGFSSATTYSGTATYLVQGGAGAVVAGNNMPYSGSTGYVNADGNTQHVVANPGYNPKGSLGPPSVPGSGTAYTNAYGPDCMVYLSGGSVSAVALGGTSTGATSGWFRVPAAQTITLTYSSAPSWSWFGD